MLDSKWGFINANGELVIDFKYEWVGVFSFVGVASVGFDGETCLINTLGEVLVSSKRRIGRLDKIKEKPYVIFFIVNEKRKLGLINTYGDLMIPPIYDWIIFISSEVGLIVFKDSQKGVINCNGDIIIELFDYKKIDWYDAIKVFIAQYKNEARIFNEKGILNFVFSSLDLCYYVEEIGGYLGFKGNEFMIYNVDGSIRVPMQYRSDSLLWWFEESPYGSDELKRNNYPFAESLINITKNDQDGMINFQGVEIIAPVYYYLGTFSEDLIPASLNYFDPIGYIDINSQFKIKPRFDWCSSFFEGFAAVRVGHLWGYINTKGEFLIEPKFIEAGDFQNGIAKVKGIQGWGLIDLKGEYIIDCLYQRIAIIDWVKKIIELENQNGIGIISFNGEIILSLLLRKLYYTNIGIISVEDSKQSLYDFNGNLIIELENGEIFENGDLIEVISENVCGFIGYDGVKYWD